MTTTLAELKALLEKATAAPWNVRGPRFGEEPAGYDDRYAVCGVPEGDFLEIPAACDSEINGRFIAAARNTLPALLAAVEKLADVAVCGSGGIEHPRSNFSGLWDIAYANPIAREALDAARRKA
jgi:hypothetical protein